MKTKKLIIAGLLAMIPILGFSQEWVEWDDIYADPSQTSQKQQIKEAPQSPKKKIVVVEGDVSKLEVKSSRDIDEYNRRGKETEEVIISKNEIEEEYIDYEFTDRIVKYHDPEAVIKITGADKITIYTDDELYSDYYRSRYCDRCGYCGCCCPWYDPWYDPWYYGWYSPWYYNPWHYGGWRWNFYFGWHSPWYYGGWYSPWHSPWYYGWYDPWFYGGWGYGGYYPGYYGGIYVGATYNSAGRSTTSYRTSAAGRSSAAGISAVSYTHLDVYKRQRIYMAIISKLW